MQNGDFPSSFFLWMRVVSGCRAQVERNETAWKVSVVQPEITRGGRGVSAIKQHPHPIVSTHGRVYTGTLQFDPHPTPMFLASAHNICIGMVKTQIGHSALSLPVKTFYFEACRSTVPKESWSYMLKTYKKGGLQHLQLPHPVSPCFSRSNHYSMI